MSVVVVEWIMELFQTQSVADSRNTQRGGMTRSLLQSVSARQQELLNTKTPGVNEFTCSCSLRSSNERNEKQVLFFTYYTILIAINTQRLKSCKFLYCHCHSISHLFNRNIMCSDSIDNFLISVGLSLSLSLCKHWLERRSMCRERGQSIPTIFMGTKQQHITGHLGVYTVQWTCTHFYLLLVCHSFSFDRFSLLTVDTATRKIDTANMLRDGCWTSQYTSEIVHFCFWVFKSHISCSPFLFKQTDTNK